MVCICPFPISFWNGEYVFQPPHSMRPILLSIYSLHSLSSICVCVYERQTKLNYGLWNSDGECQNDVQLFKWIVNLAMRFVSFKSMAEYIFATHYNRCVPTMCLCVCVIFNSIQFIWQLKLLPSIQSSVTNISLNLNRAWMDGKVEREREECVQVK